MPREIHNFQTDPKRFAGLTARRIAKGLPVGRVNPAPLEWWQVIENQTAREVARYRAEGRI